MSRAGERSRLTSSVSESRRANMPPEDRSAGLPVASQATANEPSLSAAIAGLAARPSTVADTPSSPPTGTSAAS